VDEVGKAVGQWIVSNLGWSVIIFLFILSGLFKITKKEIDPLGLVLSWIGKHFTKDALEDIAALRTETKEEFGKIKKDRADKVDELKKDYNEKIAALKTDLDQFETRTNKSIDEMKAGTNTNCEVMKSRLDKMEASNDMQTIRQIKAHVLDFANSCMNKRKHTKQDFDNIIHENEEYERLVKKYGMKNDVYTEDYNYVMKIYHKCQEGGTFLKGSDTE
jgi:hypothetical protein